MYFKMCSNWCEMFAKMQWAIGQQVGREKGKERYKSVTKRDKVYSRDRYTYNQERKDGVS